MAERLRAARNDDLVDLRDEEAPRTRDSASSSRPAQMPAEFAAAGNQAIASLFVQRQAVAPSPLTAASGLAVQSLAGNRATASLFVQRQPDDGSPASGDSGAQELSAGRPPLGEQIRFPYMDDVVANPTVAEARQQDWLDGQADYQERGAWIRWQGSPTDPSTGVRDDRNGTYLIERWPLPSVGAHDDDPDFNPNDAIDPGNPPQNDSLTFTVGHYHQHPPLDPALKRDPAKFKVGPSDEDWDLAGRLGSPGIVRDFTDTNRKATKDYRYGPGVQEHR